MTFNIDDLITDLQGERDKLSTSIEQSPAPDHITVKPNLNLKKGFTVHLADILDGLPENTTNLFMKFTGNCTYFPFNGNKSVMIGGIEQDVHFRIGEYGNTHCVMIPGGK